MQKLIEKELPASEKHSEKSADVKDGPEKELEIKKNEDKALEIEGIEDELEYNELFDVSDFVDQVIDEAVAAADYLISNVEDDVFEEVTTDDQNVSKLVNPADVIYKNFKYTYKNVAPNTFFIIKIICQFIFLMFVVSLF
jgi:hypothetical protein